MDITKLLVDLGRLSERSFRDVLFKHIKNDFYYVMDFSYDDKSSKWKYDILRVNSNADDIVSRIKLYDQASSSIIGLSFGVGTFIKKDRFEKILENASDFDERFISIKESFLNDEVVIPTNEDEMKEMWTKLKGLKGYMTLSIDGKYIVDIKGYDEIIINQLYETMRKGIEEDDFCYLCGNSDSLINGGFKEPAWKLLSITRSTNLSSDRKAFIRCMDCEKHLMLGADLVKSLSKYTNKGTKTYEEIIIPLTNKKVVIDQLLELRKETSSDLQFYEKLSSKLERWKLRGISRFIQMRVLRNQRNYTVLNNNVVSSSDVDKLSNKSKFERWLWEHRWYINGKTLLYYPPKLLDKEEDRKWYYIEQVKRYWLGLEVEKRLWESIEKFSDYELGELSIYNLWVDYIDKGEEVLTEEIYRSKTYALGVLMGLGRRLQEKEYKKYDISGEVSLKRRFNGFPKDIQRAFEEVLKVFDLNERYLTKEEKKRVREWSESFLTCEYEGEQSYYYLGMMNKGY